MDSSETTKAQSNRKQFYQNVIVMRHGDRADNFNPLWVSTAAAPWDPHIIEEGRVKAFCTGRRLRTNLGYPIHRVFISPFLRYIQTAYEVVSTLCSIDDDPTVMSSNGVVSLDPSKVKVSIEYGLCEMLNREAIRHSLAPKERIHFGIHFRCRRFCLWLTPSPVDLSSSAPICRCRIITDDRSVISSDLSPYSTPSSVEEIINLLVFAPFVPNFLFVYVFAVWSNGFM